MSELQRRITEIIGVERNGNLCSSGITATLDGSPVGHLVHNHYAGSEPYWTGQTPESVIGERKGTFEVIATSWDDINGGRKWHKKGEVIVT